MLLMSFKEPPPVLVEEQALNAGSLVCLESHVVVGVLDQLMLSATNPIYIIQSRELSQSGTPGVAVGTNIYYLQRYFKHIPISDSKDQSVAINNLLHSTGVAGRE